MSNRPVQLTCQDLSFSLFCLLFSIWIVTIVTEHRSLVLSLQWSPNCSFACNISLARSSTALENVLLLNLIYKYVIPFIKNFELWLISLDSQISWIVFIRLLYYMDHFYYFSHTSCYSQETLVGVVDRIMAHQRYSYPDSQNLQISYFRWKKTPCRYDYIEGLRWNCPELSE